MACILGLGRWALVVELELRGEQSSEECAGQGWSCCGLRVRA